MIQRDRSKNQYLLYADITRICSVMAVVVLHVSSRVVESYTNIDLYGWWAGNLANSISRWAVPSLIMLSGALLLDPNKVEPTITFFKKRGKRIVFPLIGWFLIYFLWVHFWGGQTISFEFIVKRMALGGPYYHLYYLYLIGSLYILTPTLRSYIGRTSFFERTKLTVIFFSIGIIDSFFFYLFYKYEGWYDSISSFFPLFILTFGFVGYFLAGYQLRIMSFSRRICYFALICLFLSLTITSVGTYILFNHFGLYSFGFYFYDCFSPPSIIMSLCVFIMFKEGHLLENFVGKNDKICGFVKNLFAPGTFGIYLVHPIFLDILGKYINITGSQGNAIIYLPSWVGIPFLSLVIIISSFMTTLIIRKIPYIKRIVGFW